MTYSSTLDGAVSADQTELYVDALPSEPYPPFVEIDSEVMELVSVNPNGATAPFPAPRLRLTVQRGRDGTARATHSDAATVIGVTGSGGGGGGGVSVDPVSGPAFTADTIIQSGAVEGPAGTATLAGIYVADDDPGAVGARQLWLQTDPDGNFNTLQLRVRNNANDGWFQAAAGSSYDNVSGDIGVWDTTSGDHGSGLEYSQTASYLHAQTPGLSATKLRVGVNRGIGAFLQSGNNFAYLLHGTVSPAAGLGVAADVPALYIRDNSGATELWLKTGAGDTAWSKVTTS